MAEIRDHALGQERFDKHIELNAGLTAEQLSLTLSVGFAAASGYSNEALAAIERDAGDLERAARKLGHHSRKLAKEWREQRDQFERDRKAAEGS